MDERAAIYSHLLAYTEALSREMERICDLDDEESDRRFEELEKIVNAAIPLLYALAGVPLLPDAVNDFLLSL